MSVAAGPSRHVVLRGFPGGSDGYATGCAVEIAQPEGGTVTSGNVVGVDSDAIVIELAGARQTPLPEPGLLRLRVDDNQRTIRLRAIERVVRERHTLRWVGPLLTGADPAAMDDSHWTPSENAEMTEGQGRALAGATASQDVFLIQGPPGTGKTTVIAELLRYLAHERGARVLLSSKGHRAIDNALERLDGSELQVLRLGQASKVTGAGQARLLSEVVRQAESEIPSRQGPIQARLDAQQHALEEARHALERLEYLHAEITSGEAAITQRRAELDRWLADALQELRSRMAEDDAARNRLWAWLTRLFGARDRETRYRLAAGRLDAQRRALLERRDLVELREHVASLREELARTTQTFAVPTSGGPFDPSISIADAESTRASLAAVREAQAQLELALPALQAWWMLVDRPDGLASSTVSNADVVAATAIGVDSGRDGARIADLDFDVAVIDEASQAHLMDLVVPLSRARSVILVGDHQQLPPYLDEDLLRRCIEGGIESEWLDASVFEVLWERVPSTHRARLDVQFRMPVAIADFLGGAFYDGELASAPAKHAMEPVCELFQSPVVLVDTSDDPERAETTLAQGFRNGCEARLIGLLGAALPAEYSVGVIAPYAAQVNAIRQTLAQARGLSTRDAWLVDNVATVDSFQGQERDVVIVSLTRSNGDGAVGFLSDLKRLNVTLSRARAQLVVVGDLSTLAAGVGDGRPRREAFARFMRDLREHLRVHGEVVDSAEMRARLAASA